MQKLSTNTIGKWETMTIFSEKKFKLLLVTLCVHELTKTERGCGDVPVDVVYMCESEGKKLL